MIKYISIIFLLYVKIMFLYTSLFSFAHNRNSWRMRLTEVFLVDLDCKEDMKLIINCVIPTYCSRYLIQSMTFTNVMV